ncbi:MAG: ribbon-helix-helix protein, CopG family [Alphaproteobacteria bacterium]|nr:ribbon-helix-helix protein, CopG family [Alphaproteobacteria bacterium]MBV9372998.1 ribbon-helix-helix protein, CopG family [Alphaproteobacteria bacterium]MBV9901365.1 ribbon-helix-helix protein, CopG family [Alphaproteobacteria bacterium]
MSKQHVITARIDDETVEALDRLARELDRSRAWIVANAVERYVSDELEFIDFVQEGEDDLENGRWITHQQLVEEIRERRAGRKAA